MELSETYRIPIRGDVRAKLAEARRRAAASGVLIEGDERSGSVTGMGISGTYVVSEGVVTVTILQRPFFVTPARIERSLREFLGK